MLLLSLPQARMKQGELEGNRAGRPSAGGKPIFLNRSVDVTREIPVLLHPQCSPGDGVVLHSPFYGPCPKNTISP